MNRIRPNNWVLAPPGICAAVGIALALGGCYDGRGGSGADGADDDAGETGGDTPVPFVCEDGDLDPGPNLARRLTVPEYTASVQAVLGVDIAPEAAAEIPGDLRADGFANTAAGLITTLDHVEAYATLAETAVGKIQDMDSFVGQYTSCSDFSDECERAFVENFGRQLYRGPMPTEEVDLIVPIFAAASAEGEDFNGAAALVVENMLQAPRFLFRLENETGDGSVRLLDGYEMATRLSYLVWGAPPDDELLDAAAADALIEDADVEAQVRRMLADPRVRDASKLFAGDWIHLSRLDNLIRDVDRFPAWDPALGRAMQQETLTFFETVLFEQSRPVGELFNAQETFVSPELATHYGFSAMPDAEGRVDLTDVPERGGLLTQGSVATLGGNESSMVSRGLFMLETFLCGQLGSPPPGVDTTPPDPEPGKSQRFYSEERVANSSCGGCHSQMEPLAWGLERYLADGTYAQMDDLGNDLLQDGFIRFPLDGEEVTFATTAQMMDALAVGANTAQCFAEKSIQFAIARPLEKNDDCTVDAVVDQFTTGGGTYEDLLVAIALSPGFRTLRSE